MDQDEYLKNYQFSASLVFDRIYLGSVWDSLKIEDLKKLGITHILSIVNLIRRPPFIEDLHYLILEALDEDEQNLVSQFDTCSEWIRKVLTTEKNKLLIHCTAGKSRSATIFMAYLMKVHNLSYQQAFDITQEARSKVRPNIGFQDQLNLYASSNCKVTPDLLEKCSSTHYSIRQFSRPSKIREFPKVSTCPLLLDLENEKRNLKISKEEDN